jgi:GTP cyclohydrolase I
MLEEVWEGEKYSNDEIAVMFGKSFPVDSTDMVVVKDIEAFSYCEHHLALIYNMRISIGYIPKGKVIGLSKIARIADMCCKRLQVQERIGNDIAEVMQKIVGEDVIVRIEANHSCMTARGIKKPSSKTVTLAKRGKFKEKEYMKQFLDML